MHEHVFDGLYDSIRDAWEDVSPEMVSIVEIDLGRDAKTWLISCPHTKLAQTGRTTKPTQVRTDSAVTLDYRYAPIKGEPYYYSFLVGRCHKCKMVHVVYLGNEERTDAPWEVKGLPKRAKKRK